MSIKLPIPEKKELMGMKYYLGFVAIVMTIYVYSMIVGWRYMSFGESSHSKESGARGRRTVIYHK